MAQDPLSDVVKTRRAQDKQKESALPLEPTCERTSSYFAFGPIADLARQSSSLAHEDNTQLLRVVVRLAVSKE
jgi:hypothetical protein